MLPDFAGLLIQVGYWGDGRNIGGAVFLIFLIIINLVVIFFSISLSLEDEKKERANASMVEGLHNQLMSQHKEQKKGFLVGTSPPS